MSGRVPAGLTEAGAERAAPIWSRLVLRHGAASGLVAGQVRCAVTLVDLGFAGETWLTTVAARHIDPDVWTKERFLAWAETRAGDRSYEVDGVRPVAMAPATLGHNDIARNIRETVRSRLPVGSGCKAYGPQQPIETEGGALREPDAFIACSAPSRMSVTISAPIVVFEVLSPDTENRRSGSGGGNLWIRLARCACPSSA